MTDILPILLILLALYLAPGVRIAWQVVTDPRVREAFSDPGVVIWDYVHAAGVLAWLLLTWPVGLGRSWWKKS